ncbi:MAG: NAD-dependent DNA ligase LigA, partial [Oscillospiraceae bacterium]|nr:NAD-dependent DNA ligase LigA [Oscillospiraceae bacterium]
MTEPEIRQRMQALITVLNEASQAYYGGREEIMTNFEWDAKFDELKRLEEESGITLPDSPTGSVSFSEEEPENGQKEPHEYPALSLAKTKKVEDLQKWAGDREVWLSWKLDGLTLVVTYDGGRATKILTRGNGTVGTNITYMKDAIRGIPARIDYPGHLVVRGEATISYPDFELVNAELESGEEKFANPRNLASGTLALDAKNIDKVRQRRLCFNAFTLVAIEDEIRSWGERMDFLEKSGFVVVDREKTDAAGLPDAVVRWTQRVEKGEMQIPVDGLVIAYEDTEYAAGGSVTGHHATRGGFAFKWQDESAVTMLDHVEWSCAASTITPVAVFRPVQLEGTTVSRASLVNISEMERLGIGENGKTELEVIKANKIIPKCVSVLRREGTFIIPAGCPVCEAPTEIFVSDSGTKTLRCTNAACPAKNLRKFERFVSKDGMDIDGLSIETLRDFVSAGFIHTFADIYHLDAHADAIKEMEGFGEKSCGNLLAAIEKSRKVSAANFLNALCIPLIGLDAAKRILRATGWNGFLKRLEEKTGFEDVDGIGLEKSNTIRYWYAEAANEAVFRRLL